MIENILHNSLLSGIAFNLFLTLLVIVLVLAAVDIMISPNSKHSSLPDSLQVLGGCGLVVGAFSFVSWVLLRIWGL